MVQIYIFIESFSFEIRQIVSKDEKMKLIEF